MISSEKEIEVVMRKIVTHDEYRKLIKSAKEKGWDIKAYQVGFYQEGYKKTTQ